MSTKLRTRSAQLRPLPVEFMDSKMSCGWSRSYVSSMEITSRRRGTRQSAPRSWSVETPRGYQEDGQRWSASERPKVLERGDTALEERQAAHDARGRLLDRRIGAFQVVHERAQARASSHE